MHPIVRKLSLFSPLNSEEAAAVDLVLGNVRHIPAKEEVARQGEEPRAVLFLLKGMACRHKLLTDGRRQILSFLLPGDCCEVGVSLLAQRDHAILALEDCEVASASDDAIQHLSRQYPKLRDALQWATLVEQAIAREWIANVGQRSGRKRMAHLFCEHYHRMNSLGLTDGTSCPLPLTQTDVGEALGVTPIHVNRLLQDFRRLGLLAFGDKHLRILNLPALKHMAGFDDTYLHLERREEYQA
ncbi:MAG TPA: Crp/Fnr family transcriptional regulator [Devosiaceae bacterium]|nr:Crp/Fnr family transcriptional regulator [Devosiaceae bacterium]